MLPTGQNLDVLSNYWLSAAVTNNGICIRTSAERTTGKCLVRRCFKPMSLCIFLRVIKGLLAFQAGIFRCQCQTTFQIEVFHFVLGFLRLSTTVTSPSLFISDKRGLI